MLISTIIVWHVQMVIINAGFWVVILPMWVMLGQICGQGVTKISSDLPNFPAKILPDDTHRANQFGIIQPTVMSCYVAAMAGRSSSVLKDPIWRHLSKTCTFMTSPSVSLAFPT
jgi:hypothetical protein